MHQATKSSPVGRLTPIGRPAESTIIRMKIKTMKAAGRIAGEQVKAVENDADHASRASRKDTECTASKIPVWTPDRPPPNDDQG